MRRWYQTDRDGPASNIGEFVVELFRRLEAECLDYCVLRNYSGLPDKVGNDIDLLIPASQERRFFKLVECLAEELTWRILKVERRFGLTSLWLSAARCDLSPVPGMIKIDSWSVPAMWKGIRLFSNEQVLGTILRTRGMRVANPSAAAAVTFAKEYLQDGRFGDGEKACRNKQRIEKAVELSRDDFESLLNYAFGRNLAKKITSKIRERDWSWFEQYLPLVRWIVIRRAVRSNGLRQMGNWIRFLAGHISDRFLHPTGMMMVITGPDGSGKTTNALSLKNLVETKMGSIFPRVIYLHGRFGLLPDLREIYNRVARILRLPTKAPLSQEAATLLLDSPAFHPLRAALYLAYYLFDYLAGHLYLVWWRSKGNIILFDRYSYDYLIHSPYDRVPLEIRKFLLSVMPQPQLSLYLDGDASVIRSRKPELRVDQIEDQQERYERIVVPASDSRTCRTDQPRSQVFAQVMDEFYSALQNQALAKLAQVKIPQVHQGNLGEIT